MLVLGDREIEARTVAPRARNAARGEQQEAVAWDDLADRWRRRAANVERLTAGPATSALPGASAVRLMPASTDRRDRSGRPADAAAACPARCSAHERHRSRQPSSSVTATTRRRRRRLVRRRGRRDLRHPRPERRRQDHHRRVHRGPAAPRTRARITVLGLDPRDDRDELRQRSASSSRRASCRTRSRVREALELYASFYREPGRLASGSSTSSASATSATPRSASSRAARSSGCRSPWRWSATRGSRSSTS